MNANALKKAGLGVGIVYAAAYALQSASVSLRHFSASDFGLWFPLINTKTLINLDEFREVLGYPVYVSPVVGAVGRLPGAGVRNGSSHIPSPLIDAVDVMTDAPLSEAYDAARKVGFHGIGLYPDWKPRQGLHLDMRSERTAQNPATWSALRVAGKQQYFGIERALA